MNIIGNLHLQKKAVIDLAAGILAELAQNLQNEVNKFKI